MNMYSQCSSQWSEKQILFANNDGRRTEKVVYRPSEAVVHPQSGSNRTNERSEWSSIFHRKQKGESWTKNP
jgi:hypothetical protein